jgi:predicted HicB family RNase H-like nuclease
MARPLDGRSSTQVRLLTDLKRRLKAYAALDGITLEDYITKVLTDHADHRRQAARSKKDA